MVKHSYDNIPYYRELFEKNGIHPSDVSTVDDIHKIPITTKESLVGKPLESRIARGTRPEDCLKTSTSGSTGTPFAVLHSQRDGRFMRLVPLRTRLMHGLLPWDKMLCLHERKINRKWYEDFGLLVCDYHTLEETGGQILRLLERGRYQIIAGLTSNLLLLAKIINEKGIPASGTKKVLTSGEMMDGKTSDTICQALGATPIDIYGSNEVGHVAFQCNRRIGYHINADVVLVEIVSDGRPAQPGEVGEVVVTTLDHYTMPFIRYAQGDLATLSKHKCTCSCTFPLIDKIEGRTVDCVVLPSGRVVSPYAIVATVVKGHNLKQFQVTQIGKREIEVVFSTTSRNTREISKNIQQKMTGFLDDEMTVKAKYVKDIPQTKEKLRMVRNLAVQE